MFDDDGKAGPGSEDDIIGVSFFSLSKLEQAFKTRSPLLINDRKKGKTTGQIFVRSFRENRGEGVSASGGGSGTTPYPTSTPLHQGYPPLLPPQNVYTNPPYPPQPSVDGNFGEGFSKPEYPNNNSFTFQGVNSQQQGNGGGFTLPGR